MSTYEYPSVPREIIVVEGRDDTKRLIETFGPTIKTIETKGSAIDSQILEQIKSGQEEFGVIVLTDPDYPGERIRKIIAREIPEAKHAFLRRDEAQSSKAGQSLGVEHAQSEQIIQALDEIVTPNLNGQYDYISKSDLMTLKLIAHPQAKQRRAYIARKLRLGQMNGKQLQKRLALYNIKLDEIITLLEEGERVEFEA